MTRLLFWCILAETMNIHVSYEIREKWPTYEFIGKPFKLADGKTYMKAFHKTLGCTHFYSFEEDFFWWDKPIYT